MLKSFFVLLAVLLVSACAPRRIPGTDITGASVVTLVRPQLGIDEDGIEPTPPRYTPYCNAFAVRGDYGPVLVTASHCAKASSVRYLSPNGVGYRDAEVVTRDAKRDLAWLRPADAKGLVPLDVSPPPGLGAAVFAVADGVGERADGKLIAPYRGGFFETDLQVRKGGSGAPVLDNAGHVWGVVVGCVAVQRSAFEHDVRCLKIGRVSALQAEP